MSEGRKEGTEGRSTNEDEDEAEAQTGQDVKNTKLAWQQQNTQHLEQIVSLCGHTLCSPPLNDPSTPSTWPTRDSCPSKNNHNHLLTEKQKQRRTTRKRKSDQSHVCSPAAPRHVRPHSLPLAGTRRLRDYLPTYHPVRGVKCQRTSDHTHTRHNLAA
ncbi:hypothetical protein BC567DRAFT_315 [Phyllosticta citribraziliensis]